MKNLYTIPASSSLSDALNLFETHKVSTLAVTGKNFISAGGRVDVFTPDGKQVIGLVSALDICRLYLENYNLNVSVLNAVGESLESQSLWVLEKSASLSSLLELFSKGIHSVFLKENDQFEIFTRMDLVSILLENYSLILKESIHTLCKKVVKVNSYENILDTLKEMSQNQIYALPIVQQEQLVGTISLSDFKDVISKGNLNVSLEYFKKPDMIDRGTCTMEDSIETVLKKIRTGHIHRLWILQGSQVVGVVSLSDIFAHLLKKL